jgi:two-component system sporulation sensor kinase A
MGLGLAISQKIVREHKGDITVSSEPNKGTVVKVVLPQGAV